MISTLDITADPLERDRMLVVGNCFAGRDWIDGLRARYPEWTVATCNSYLSGIAELSRQPARAVLACVDPSLTQLGNAVAGLRKAAGAQTRLVLCCTSESEPATRRVLASGADDYVLYPLEGNELDTAIGYHRMNMSKSTPLGGPVSILVEPTLQPGAGLTASPAASMDELAQLGAVLAAMGEKPSVLLERIASLICMALAARGATVVVEGAVATSGEVVSRPVLSTPLTGAKGTIGRLSVGERVDGPFSPADSRKLSHYAAVVSHVLEAASTQRQWRQLAVTDECSGLPNRRYLHAKLDAILARAAAERFHVTLLLFDVDDFKTYNDECGHAAGDEVLRVTGELFRQCCRRQDIVARYGGDEFVVVFWDSEGPRVAGSKHPDCALAVLERFNEALRSQAFPQLGPSGTGRLTISGGLATYPWDAPTREALLKRADDALLTAKRAGKNRIFLIGEVGNQRA